MKKKFKVLSLLVCVVLVLSLFCGCGGGYEKKLTGSWYHEGYSSPYFTLYSDGTCEINGEYGTGKWAVVNENQLKLTNFYGESEICGIEAVKGGTLTLDNGTVLYSSAQN